MKLNVTVEVKKITPEIASEYLANRWGEQRNLRAAQVARIASDMEAGRFRISPDAICRIKGKLANGQHRLEAVVATGKSQSFLVMETNDEDLYKAIDAGLRRTVSDGLIGLPFAKSMPSIARWVKAYDSQTIWPSARNASEAAAGSGSYNGFVTQSEMIDYCREHQEILSAAASFVNPLYEQTRLLPVSIGGAIYVIGENRNKSDKTHEFLRQVYVEGGTTAAGDLRNRLIANRGSKAKLKPGYIFGISIKALKSFYNGTRPGVLKIGKDEEFPTI
jgi:hypothetical protein